MASNLFWRSALLLMVAAAAHAQAPPPAPPATGADYRLHAGDKLEVSVWKETEMQKPAVIVRPDGKFSFPLAGDVQAAGKSVQEVRQAIETRLKAFIPDPVVTVSVNEVGGNVAYVIGQVAKPGAYIMNPSLNVLQALSLAGGATPFAKLDNIIVIRSGQGEQRPIPFRYEQVASGKDLKQNITLESGDVVVVP
jgi:polysaccharide export outer membrane protein